ncbi:hypothetical protein EIP91_012205, partial [Steccherinum ochraceum]
HASVGAVQQHFVEIVRPVAERFGLRLVAFGHDQNVSLSGEGEGEQGEEGVLTLSDAWGTASEPAPPTPIDEAPYQILMGTIKATLGESQRYQEREVVVSPMLALWKTDTRFYWNLTRHIFGYRHLGDEDTYNGAHTVNEAIRVDALIDNVRFLTKFILNWDEAQEWGRAQA